MNGSAKRIKELQHQFDSPDRYGKGLDWSGFTVHDAANILRRYINQLPQPIVPLEFYEKFRNPLRSHQAQAVGDMEAQAQDTGNFDPEAAIAIYQKLITELPPLNRQLLLYILDLLAVFASKQDKNRMGAPNLAAIFQPGMLSHPTHDMHPAEYRLSQDVIIFLIENQDHFLVGMNGTGVDEKTVKDLQNANQRPPNTPTKATQAGLGRSASNASAGADSLRKQGGIRRNLSVSSRNSRSSGNTQGAGSPVSGSPLTTTNSGGGVHRSNTVPSKKSPAMPSGRFRNTEAASPTARKLSPGVTPSPRTASPGSKLALKTVEGDNSTNLNAVPETTESIGHKATGSKTLGSSERLTLRTPDQGVTTTITAGSSATPTREKRGGLFSKSPSSDTERKDGKQPNKLRKKRTPALSSNASAQSSSHDLNATSDSPATQILRTPTAATGLNTQQGEETTEAPTFSNTDTTPQSEQPPRIGEIERLSAFHVSQPGSTPGASPRLNPEKSPAGSLRSGTEDSEMEHADEETKAAKKKHRWRLSSSVNKLSDKSATPASGSRLGSNAVAEKSTTSVASEGGPRKSVTNDSQTQKTSTDMSASSNVLSSHDATPSKDREVAAVVKEKENSAEDKKGPLGWIKGKVAKAKEERKEREAEKERAKSPPRNGNDHATSKQSLGAIANQEVVPNRGRSTSGAEAMDTRIEGEPVTTPTPSQPQP